MTVPESRDVPDAPPSGPLEAVLGPLRAAIAHAASWSPARFERAEQIDGIAGLETVRNAVEALQAEWTLGFATAEAAHQTRNGQVEPEKIERSIGAQVGLACRVSPTEGRRRVRTARDLNDGLDHLRGLFGAGEVGGYRVSTVVGATSHLDARERAEVDRLLSDWDITRLGVGRLRDLARKFAAQVAPDKFRTRCAAARSGRRVTLRPAADGMTDLIAHLPAEQGAACYAALQRAFTEEQVKPAPMTRGRGQVMADTLVERVTGQTTAEAVGLQVQVVVPVEALVDPASPLPAEIPGHGPVPVDLIATAAGRKTWRRFVTRDGVVIGGDSKQQRFTGFLAELVRARDRWRCSEPYCDAPVRQIDHIRRRADGGPTTFDDGRGTCVLHNLLREDPEWTVERVPDGVRTTTPTGHRYTARRGR
ncbi:HNH endonuclease [Pseudonocardia endophytica]|uniref:Uncharacterized protein DUF222 n=1 Tax=Pseudonocardia endophytica TaxID=401976 RepID=A0A4R1HUY4_PSEEN|nr:HNH endonuclease signature motif containing protein [Pseudonocardia endophytica]TCK21262.1 uncharacterized protein DUF222 [Pseudonocardia endophytica]